MTTQAEYTNTVVAGVIAGLPMQDVTSATTLVTTYMTSVGGWIADDGLNPTGAGHLYNNASTDTTIAAVIAAQYATIYESLVNLDLTLSFQTVTQLTAGLNESQIKAGLSSVVRDAVTTYMTGFGLVASAVSVTSTTSSANGALNAARRVALEAESPQVSVSRIALTKTRAQFALDTHWSVFAIYTKSASPVSVIVKRYTDSSFATLDLTTAYFYVIKIDPVSKHIVSGIRINP